MDNLSGYVGVTSYVMIELVADEFYVVVRSLGVATERMLSTC